MPSAIGHAAPALAVFPLFRSRVPRRLWRLGIACAMAPDLDVLAFRFGIPYERLARSSRPLARPIQVSPLGVDAFFSSRGLEVLLSELVWV